MNNLLRPFLIFLGILLIAGVFFIAGYFSHQYLSRNVMTNNDVLINSTENNNSQSFFTSQIATIQGKITSINGSDLTIRNSKGISATIPAGKDILIYKTLPDKIATPSADLKSIELGKDANITASGVDGKFEVTVIHY